MKIVGGKVADANIAVGVFDRVDAIRDLRDDQYQGIEPSEGDVAAALLVMERVRPELMAALAIR